MYLLHLFSSLDQTYQLFKFLFDAKCQVMTSQRLRSSKWITLIFNFKVKLEKFERDLDGE